MRFMLVFLLAATALTPAFSATAAAVAPLLVSPPQDSVDKAIARPLMTYSRKVTNGAFTGDALIGGATITLAVASYAGNVKADARLLDQIRAGITGGKEIVGNGGYPAQHELHLTGLFAIARHTPRTWSQLTPDEKARVDLVMQAALVESAFVTSDSNPYVTSRGQQYALDGDDNMNRDWNPNFREGMLGGVLVGAAYFGPAQAQALLAAYDHQAFTAKLKAAGLTNLYDTFTWKAAHADSKGPSGDQIQAAVRGYLYYATPVTDPLAIYGKLVAYTYGKTVNAGLKNGEGIKGAGKISAGAAGLPNLGQPGMLLEFDSMDGGGPRSSAHYCYDGFRPNQTITLALIAAGLWIPASSVAQDATRRMDVGVTDLFYKLDQGYVGYAKGKSQGLFDSTDKDFGFEFSRPMWEAVLKPYLHGGAAKAKAGKP